MPSDHELCIGKEQDWYFDNKEIVTENTIEEEVTESIQEVSNTEAPEIIDTIEQFQTEELVENTESSLQIEISNDKIIPISNSEGI